MRRCRRTGLVQRHALTLADVHAVDPIAVDVAQKRLSVHRQGQTDAAALADLHQQNFPNDLFTLAGRRVLRALFEDFAEEISLVAELDGRPVGYCVGALNKRRFMTRLVQRHALTLVAGGVPAMVRHPGAAFEYFRGFIRWIGRRQSSNDEATAVGMYLAVSKDAKALGISPLFFLELHSRWIAYAEELGARRIESQVTDPRMLAAFGLLGYGLDHTAESRAGKKYYITCQLPSEAVRSWISRLSGEASS